VGGRRRSTGSFIAGSHCLSDAGCVALRCLIVDDNEDFLSSASRLLESQGLDVVGRVSSGSDAVRLAASLRPEVVLLDVVLGEEDGFKIARRLAATTPSTRVVLISTHPEEDLAEGLADSPAVGFLSKRSLSAKAIAELVS
jgi:two-component system, NarL family, nitrate/nitrite response regulator NarL